MGMFFSSFRNDSIVCEEGEGERVLLYGNEFKVSCCYLYKRMDFQDWTTVVLRKGPSKKSGGGAAAAAARSGDEVQIQPRDQGHHERARMNKLEEQDLADAPKKRVHSESIQQLIRKRIEMKLNQEKADQLCNFSRNTFKEIEAHRLIPNAKQQSVIQRFFGVSIKIAVIPPVGGGNGGPQ